MAMARSNRPSMVLSRSTKAQVPAITKQKVREPFLKRPLDVILSFFMIILSLPVSVPIALGIKLEDAGSIFYRQERWGRDGIFLNNDKNDLAYGRWGVITNPFDLMHCFLNGVIKSLVTCP